LIRFLSYVAVALSLTACTTLERATLPDPVLLEQKWQEAATTATQEIDQSTWDVFLERYVRTDIEGINRVDYGSVTATDHDRLRDYLSRLEQTDTKTLSRAQQLAFWINLYNAKTVDLVLDAYPVETILKIKDGLLPTGPWRRKVVQVDSEELSLNDIEHRIVRPVFQEARIHYALNCAALGCPNLMSRAWRAETLETDLAAAERAYVNDPRGLRFDEKGRLTLSKIYRWFQEDFGRNEAEILESLSRVAAPDVKTRLLNRKRVDRYHYDWSLNDAKTGIFGTEISVTR